MLSKQIFIQIVMGNEKWILYNNAECEGIMRQAKWIAINHTKGWASSKDNAVYMVGLEESSLQWAPSGETYNWFEQVLLPIRPIEGRNWWKMSVMRKGLIFHQVNARLCIF